MTMTAMVVVVMTGHTGLEYDLIISWAFLRRPKDNYRLYLNSCTVHLKVVGSLTKLR